jgi:hypothetical protein
MRTVRYVRVFALFCLLTAWLFACSSSKKKKKPQDPEQTDSATQDTSNPPDPNDNEEYELEIKPHQVKSVATKTENAGEEDTCTDNISVKVTKGGVAKAKVKLGFRTIDRTSAKVGKAVPELTETDEEGVALGKFCAGESAGKAKIMVRAGKSIKEVGDVLVFQIKKTAFEYVGYNYSSEAIGSNVVYRPGTRAGAIQGQDKPIVLNLRSSGLDCGILVFQARLGGEPVAGQTVKFRSNTEYPIGANLGKRGETAVTEIDPITSRPYLIFNAVSDGSGVFQVPVCASYFPGSFYLSGAFERTTSEGRKYEFQVDSPAITVEGGQTNWGNMSYTFNKDNHKVVLGSLLSNLGTPLDFAVQAFSRYDGPLSNPFPFGVNSEFGKLEFPKDGAISDKGVLDIKLTPFNLYSYRPVRVTSPGISRGLNYSPLCEPDDFATGTRFSDVGKDWKSTVMTYTQGGEAWFDANNNGIFDENGALGFWDKNQNGVLDCSHLNENVCDVVTAVGPDRSDAEKALKNRAFNQFTTVEKELVHNNTVYAKDWFIDMASPFVDSNENGTPMLNDTTPEVGEFVLGSGFNAPNGKWDNLTYIWKDSFFHIFAGLTEFSMTSRVLGSQAAHSSDLLARMYSDSAGSDVDFNANPKRYLAAFFKAGYGNTLMHSDSIESLWNGALASGSPGYPADGVVGPQNTNFLLNGGIYVSNGANLAGGASLYRYFFAQGSCGTSLPGGTKMELKTETFETQEGKLGRTVDVFMINAPGDELREVARNAVQAGTGSGSYILGPSIAEHPISAVSYPLVINTRMTSCANPCLGNVTTAGFYCPALQTTTTFSVETPLERFKFARSSYFASTQTCVCAGGGRPVVNTDKDFVCF